MEISDAIEERKRKIKELETEIEALVLAAEILKGSAKTEKPKSQPDMAYAILEEVGTPMHVSQIAEQVRKLFKTSIKPNNLAVMLFRYAKRGSKFYKYEGKPNTYGLLKWQPIAKRLESKTHDVDTVIS
jgi:hypothetical protein